MQLTFIYVNKSFHFNFIILFKLLHYQQAALIGNVNDDVHHAESSDEEEILSGNMNDVLHYADSSGEEEIGEADNDVNFDENSNEYNVNNNLFTDPLYEEKILPDSAITVGSAIALIMAFVLQHSLTKLALDDLLSLLHIFIPHLLLPKTRYLFDKIFSVCQGKLEQHFYCNKCSTCTYLGTTISDFDVCPVCEVDVQSSLNRDFFLVLPLEHQLREMLENSNLFDLIQYRFDRVKNNADNIEDIYDGSSYKSIAELQQTINMSLTWNCDGASAFRSSIKSIWPLQCVINELPFNIRRKHVLLTGLWFGAKPKINTFLKVFVEECSKLASTGFLWFNKAQNKNIVSKVYCLVCSCDSSARCVLQNIKQFNGKYGCSWCLNPGIAISNSNGGPPKRVFDNQLYPSRTLNGFVDDVRYLVENGEIRNGVKGASPLLLIPYFNIIDGFVVDYMHCILLGVARQMSVLWLEKNNEPWYIGNKINSMNEMMLKIKPPNNITRAPRSFHERAHWKASEWRNWLLFYSLFVLHGVLPQVYYNHFLLLVESIYILLSKSLSHADLDQAENQLHVFVSDFSVIYAIDYMTYNIHLLQHISSTVREWGPLWGISNFMFENSNGFLLDLFKGTQSVPLQICRTFTLYRNLPIIGAKYLNTVPESVIKFFDQCLSRTNTSGKAICITENVKLFGAPKYKFLTNAEKRALETILPNVVPDQLAFFERAVVNGQMVQSQQYVRSCSRINYCVVVRDNILCLVSSFVIVNNECYVFLIKLTTGRCAFLSHNAISRHIMTTTGSNSNTLVAMLANEIQQKCLFLPLNVFSLVTSYVCFLPNQWEID
ncbi:uncharacterized protein LOC124815310 isoform X2 [Hydra vulgaris]|uniref:uncharacterized protein LOC124815310 isoform X2 n=1 Tax=Hydra vulgaris TaxID=6087 RepID=UPI0032EA7E67